MLAGYSLTSKAQVKMLFDLVSVNLSDALGPFINLNLRLPSHWLWDGTLLGGRTVPVAAVLLLVMFIYLVLSWVLGDAC